MALGGDPLQGLLHVRRPLRSAGDPSPYLPPRLRGSGSRTGQDFKPGTRMEPKGEGLVLEPLPKERFHLAHWTHWEADQDADKSWQLLFFSPPRHRRGVFFLSGRLPGLPHLKPLASHVHGTKAAQRVYSRCRAGAEQRLRRYLRPELVSCGLSTGRFQFFNSGTQSTFGSPARWGLLAARTTDPPSMLGGSQQIRSKPSPAAAVLDGLIIDLER